jgi:hypothetical protein
MPIVSAHHAHQLTILYYHHPNRIITLHNYLNSSVQQIILGAAGAGLTRLTFLVQRRLANRSQLR